MIRKSGRVAFRLPLRQTGLSITVAEQNEINGGQSADLGQRPRR